MDDCTGLAHDDDIWLPLLVNNNKVNNINIDIETQNPKPLPSDRYSYMCTILAAR